MLSDVKIGEIVAEYSHLGVTNWGKVIREIEAAARSQALEEAAKVCDEVANTTPISSGVVWGDALAKKIRALAEQAKGGSDA